jgi:alkanesulfonate monooxygenase SsuD/methylene tetrahydromethanopterin reductase-like flavin-dependent oxidoreductase (luciferase family)
MRFGLFTMPSHPPERSLFAGLEFDLDTIRWADELGYSEAWVGEHHTAPWEPNPAPDLLVAQALLQTKQIRLGPGGFLLPYHHPAELANRAAMLDHLSQGRLLLGIAAGGLTSDWAMFNVDGNAGVNRAMTRESLEIILKLWTEDEFEYRGQFWTVKKPGPMFDGILGPHILPFQKPHPPIGVSGVSANSETLRLAGERGFIPMSPSLNAALMASHWTSVEDAARRVGRSPSRSDWRVVREVLVADTDEEALRWSLDGPIGRQMGEYFLPLLASGNALRYLKHDQDMPDSDVTPAYCARHHWLIGSPTTVAEKLERLYEQLGGFGVLLVEGFDYADQPERWRHSLELFAREVMPRVAHLTPAQPAAVA